MTLEQIFRQLSHPVSILVNNSLGMTINSVQSFSIHPELLSLNIYNQSPLLPLQEFELYCLQSHHKELAKYYIHNRTLIEMPKDALYIKCRCVHQFPIADHSFIIATPYSSTIPKTFKQLGYVQSKFV